MAAPPVPAILPPLPSAPTDRDWARTLHLFLNCRLRASRHVANGSGSISGGGIPSMPANTQFLIDGIAMAVDDHATSALVGWGAIGDHLRACAGRYARLRSQLLDVQHGAQRYGRDTIQWAAHATVQDLYLAWCVVDGVAKTTRLAEVRHAAEAEWPRLVALHMSLLWHGAGAAPGPALSGDGDSSSSRPNLHVHVVTMLDSAVAQFRPLFLDLLRSWAVTAGRGAALRPDTRRRMEDHVRQALLVAAESAQQRTGGALLSADRAGNLHGTAVAQLLQSHTGAGPATAGSPHGGGGYRGRFGGTPARLLDLTVMQLSDANRQPFGCRHCGAHFKSSEACSQHYRLHFLARGLADPMLRLRPCSRGDFLAHHVPGLPDGSFVKTVAPLGQAYGMTDAAVVVRPVTTALVGVGGGAASGAALGGAWQERAGVRKRPRGGAWLVDDPGQPVPCAMCGLAFQTQMDGASGEWMLVDAVDGPGGIAGVCHSGCAGR